MKKIIIAIDGVSGCGKSVTAKNVADKLHYLYINTGAMYRAITLFFLQKNISLDEKEISYALKEIKIDFKYNPKTQKQEITLNDIYVEKQIRSLQVANYVSSVSTILSIRKFLFKQQRQIGKKKEIVMEGRDIGTVVFPKAELKIFMTANIDIRSKRRYNELIEKGQKVNLENVKANLIQRDQMDTTRSDSPLRKASDAVVIDTSYLAIQEQTNHIVTLASQIINSDS